MSAIADGLALVACQVETDSARQGGVVAVRTWWRGDGAADVILAIDQESGPGARVWREKRRSAVRAEDTSPRYMQMYAFLPPDLEPGEYRLTALMRQADSATVIPAVNPGPP